MNTGEKAGRQGIEAEMECWNNEAGGVSALSTSMEWVPFMGQGFINKKQDTYQNIGFYSFSLPKL